MVIWPKMKEKDCNQMLQSKSKDEITSIILDNVYSGFEAKMKLTLS